MKSLKSVLVAIAFVFAFGAAFAFQADSNVINKRLTNGTTCQLASLPAGCQIGPGPVCVIEEAEGQFQYFQGPAAGICQTALSRVP